MEVELNLTSLTGEDMPFRTLKIYWKVTDGSEDCYSWVCMWDRMTRDDDEKVKRGWGSVQSELEDMLRRLGFRK